MLPRLSRTSLLFSNSSRMIDKEAKEEMEPMLTKKDLARKITKDLRKDRRLRECQVNLTLLIDTLALATPVLSKIRYFSCVLIIML